MPGASSPAPVNNIALRSELSPAATSPIPPKRKPARGPNGQFLPMATGYPPSANRNPTPDIIINPDLATRTSTPFTNISLPASLPTFPASTSRPASPDRADQQANSLAAQQQSFEARIEERLSRQDKHFENLAATINNLIQTAASAAARTTAPATLPPERAETQQVPPAPSRTMQGLAAEPLLPTPPAQTFHHYDANAQAHIPPGTFALPLTANPAAGASPSIASLFPHVPQDILSAVLRHELRAEDLFKLDFRFKEQPQDLPLTLRDGQLRQAGQESSSRYRTPDSVITPFINYITILTGAAVPTGNALEHVSVLHEYLHQLMRNIADYEWPAVLSYHMAFWAYRNYEMRQGLFSRWAYVDQQLHSRFLANHLKRSGSSQGKSSSTSSNSKSTQICFLFNKGSCHSPCNHGRRHICSQCNSTAHALPACPQKTADKSK